MSELWIYAKEARDLIERSGFPEMDSAQQLLSRLRDGTVASRAELFYENKATEPTARQVVLPPDFWDFAEVRSADLSLLFLPHFAKWNGRSSQRGSLAQGILVRRTDVTRTWLGSSPDAAVGSKPGRKPAISWEDCLIEAACFVTINGLPIKQSDLFGHLLQWCDHGVGESQMKEHIAPFYRKVKAGV